MYRISAVFSILVSCSSAARHQLHVLNRGVSERRFPHLSADEFRKEIEDKRNVLHRRQEEVAQMQKNLDVNPADIQKYLDNNLRSKVQLDELREQHSKLLQAETGIRRVTEKRTSTGRNRGSFGSRGTRSTQEATHEILEEGQTQGSVKGRAGWLPGFMSGAGSVTDVQFNEPTMRISPTYAPTYSPTYAPTHSPTYSPTPQATHRPTPTPRRPTPSPTPFGHVPEQWEIDKLIKESKFIMEKFNSGKKAIEEQQKKIIERRKASGISQGEREALKKKQDNLDDRRAANKRLLDDFSAKKAHWTKLLKLRASAKKGGKGPQKSGKPSPKPTPRTKKKSNSFQKQKPPVVSGDTYRVLSYNICWGCTTGDSKDNTGLKSDLAKECRKKDNNNITNCARNIGNSIKKFNDDIGEFGYDFIGLQEGQGYANLALAKKGLDLDVVKLEARTSKNPGGYKGGIPVVTLYNRKRLGNYSKKVQVIMPTDRIRAAMILIFDTKKLMFINYHNIHQKKGVFQWKNFMQVFQTHLNSSFKEKPARKGYRVIMVGDFNDPYGSLPNCMRVPWNNKMMNLPTSLVRTCCEGQLGKKRTGRGDYIFDSMGPARYRVPKKYNLWSPQSDHLPIEAILSSKTVAPIPRNVVCCTRGKGNKCVPPAKKR